MPDAPSTVAVLDLIDWMRSRLKILNKSGQLVSLTPKPEQLRILHALWSQAAAGLPMRVLILKARQIGASTITDALIFAMTSLISGITGLIAAHDADSSDVLFRMCQRFEANLPAGERKATDYSNRAEIIWSTPHGSALHVQTAGKTTSGQQQQQQATLGRTRTIQVFHGSEVAFWRNAAETLLSVLSAVPEEPGTLVVLESTAAGAAGPWYDKWRQAVARMKRNPSDLNGFIPIFISWLSEPDYRIDLAPDESEEPRDDEERRLVGLGAEPEQLKWRRKVLNDKCGGDEDRFRQEFPATPDEAFQMSGRPAIAASIIRRHEKTVKPPMQCVRLHRGPAGVVARITGAADPVTWWVWQEPKELRDYIVFGDVAEGGLSDPANPKSQPDYHGGVVLSRATLEVVATFRAQVDPDDFGEQLLRAAEWYNMAWGSPEINAAGAAALAVWKKAGYQNLFQRQRATDSVVEGDAPLWGWRTTSANRNLMIDDYLALARMTSDGTWDGRIVVYDERIVSEERTFVAKKTGKREHMPGCHDDLLFALFGAVQLHLACPRQLKRPEPLRVNPVLTGPRYIGGIDKDEEEGDGSVMG